MRETHTYTKKEEIAHAITHGIGVLLSIAGLVLLIVFSSMKGNPWQIVSVTIFGVTMLIMYLTSTIVHSLPKGKRSEEHTSELQSRFDLVCRLLLEKKK